MPLTDTPAGADEVAASGGSASSVTSFSPPAGSLAVAVTGWLFATNTTGTTLACRDSLGNSYALLVQGGDPFGVVALAVFAFPYASAPGPVTLTVTDTSSGSAGCLIEPHVITGQAATYKGNTATASSASSSAAAEVGITATATGSLVFLAASPLVTVQPSADGATATATWWNDAAGSGDAVITGRTALATGTPGPVTVGWAMSPASANGYGVVAAEIVPAAVSSAPSALIQPSRTWREQFGHYHDKLRLPLYEAPARADQEPAAGADGGELVGVTGATGEAAAAADGGESAGQLVPFTPVLPSPTFRMRFRASSRVAIPFAALFSPDQNVLDAETCSGTDTDDGQQVSASPSDADASGAAADTGRDPDQPGALNIVPAV